MTQLAISPETEIPPVAETEIPKGTELPLHYHRCWELRLQGKSVSQIAEMMGGVDRSTIHRRLNRVREEYRTNLESKSHFELVSQELEKYDSLEDEHRRYANATTSERIRCSHLSEIRKICQSRQQLLLNCGLVPKVAEQMFHLVENLKPMDQRADDGLTRLTPWSELSKDQRQARLIKMYDNLACLDPR